MPRSRKNSNRTKRRKQSQVKHKTKCDVSQRSQVNPLAAGQAMSTVLARALIAKSFDRGDTFYIGGRDD